MKTVFFSPIRRASLLLLFCLLPLLLSAEPPLREARAVTLPLAGSGESRPQSFPSREARVPGPLRPWIDWALWDAKDVDCPASYLDAKKTIAIWPSRLNFQVEKTGGRFDFGVTVFAETWVPLPGGREAWPVEVKEGSAILPVMDRKGRPSVFLRPGHHKIEGSFRWIEIPLRIPLPREIGLLALTVEGKPMPSPVWDAKGFLWLKRDATTEETDKDFLATKVYALVEDGIPLWLKTEVEVIVSGKSREEELGQILPTGWQLAKVNSPIPVAVDDAGRVKAQVRAGKWTIEITAFRIDNPKEFSFATGAKPTASEELVAFRAKPDFRMIDIVGSPSIDISQTTFPQKWREFPVYRWDTATPFKIEERMRGMGLQKPAGLHINRDLWLDESGEGLTFRDQITGQMQQIWRLDAAEGQDLGSVRAGGEGQLITRNPANGAPGVEIRARNINLEATGRMKASKEMSATGWRSDADGLNVTLNLPPGWRLYALLGADWVQGDWLTAWTLLDLFLLLIFSLAVSKLWGPSAAIVAFLAFGISYHEPGAPRYVWLALLIPLALLRVVPPGWGRNLLQVWKWLTVAVLILIMAPFVARQVQQTLYPQLERVGRTSHSHGQVISNTASPVQDEEEQMHRVKRTISPEMNNATPVQAEGEQTTLPENAPNAPAPASQAADMRQSQAWSDSFGLTSNAPARRQAKDGSVSKSNLSYDTKARIQTGPGVPEWGWRSVRFGWNGPVQSTQVVRPILIPLNLERFLTILRIALLLLLAAILLNARRMGGSLLGGRTTTKAAAILIALGAWGAAPLQAQSQMPDQQMLDALRTRLLEPSEAFPNAADIPSVALVLNGRKITMDAEIHAAARTAVPLPGRLPAWSPVTVTVDGKPESVLRRDDGYLWVALTEGVHRVRVEGLISDATEWEWTFQLKPHRVSIEAPGWTVSGVKPDGTPEQQVFFALKQKTTSGEASYDRQDFQSVAAVDRNLELGLVWQVQTTVTRLSSEGKALALKIPLLPGENVLTSNAVVKDGFIEVRIGAHETAFTWESELPISQKIQLEAKPTASWVERWHLVASPVWNVAISGLAPTFEPRNPDLVPVWHPWPGESVSLAVSRPEAIAGATVTVNRANHEVTLGSRQRTSKLDLSLRCSLGEDFLVDLPAGAEITLLTHSGKAIPARKDGNKLIIPLKPGSQSVQIVWKTNLPLGIRASVGTVRLPVESANVNTVINVPSNRWVLGTHGPLRGPAVRFWGILVCSLLAAWILSRVPLSPVSAFSWMLLAIGLTQIPLPAALVVIGWLFFLSWRGTDSFKALPPVGFNLLQVVLIGLTAAALGIFIAVVAEGLLGNPEMFILGNGSSRTCLRWYQARCGAELPDAGCATVSIWWYRFFMLVWALWLAAALVRWLRWGWGQFGSGGFFRKSAKPTPPPHQPATPPPIPEKS